MPKRIKKGAGKMSNGRYTQSMIIPHLLEIMRSGKYCMMILGGIGRTEYAIVDRGDNIIMTLQRQLAINLSEELAQIGNDKPMPYCTVIAMYVPVPIEFVIAGIFSHESET